MLQVSLPAMHNRQGPPPGLPACAQHPGHCQLREVRQGPERESHSRGVHICGLAATAMTLRSICVHYPESISIAVPRWPPVVLRGIPTRGSSGCRCVAWWAGADGLSRDCRTPVGRPGRATNCGSGRCLPPHDGEHDRAAVVGRSLAGDGPVFPDPDGVEFGLYWRFPICRIRRRR
jgi:hypothetical protein